MKKITTSKVLTAVFAFFGMISCSESIQFTEVNGEETNGVKVLFSVDKFEDAHDSRTTMDPNNNYQVVWAENDTIGIFPLDGFQEPFIIPANQVGKTQAEFDGGYWALKSGLKYNAYYPFDKVNFESSEMKTEIPVSYVGQKQVGTSCCAGKYDYTYSDWTMAGTGSVSFSFHHLGAIAIFNVKYPATTTYTKLTLSAGTAIIPTVGTYDLTAQSVALHPTAYARTLDLTLTDCSGVAGHTGTFYMMLPPMNLSGNDVTLTLTSSAGTTCNYDVEVSTIVKGKKYEFIGTPQSSSVDGTIDGWEDDNGSNPGTTGNGLTITWASDVTAEQKAVLTKLVNNMVKVEGGTFMMGSDDSDAYSDEKPVHSVTLTNDYYIGKYEVTQEEWVAVMGSNPSYFSGTNLPVEKVSWNDIVNDFLPKLNRMTGLAFRLPTEAEWEFAARGGNKSCGYKYSGSNTIDDVAWYGYGFSSQGTATSFTTYPVGTKQANELGLYDMSGNVREWCSDWWSSSYYSTSPSINPTGPSSGSGRVLRGGSWYYFARYCLVSIRFYDYPGYRCDNFGCRLAL